MPKVAKGRKFRSSALRKASSGTTTAEDRHQAKGRRGGGNADTGARHRRRTQSWWWWQAAIVVIIISSRRRAERSVKTRPEHHHNHTGRRQPPTATAPAASLSRGQRKRQAKRDQYLRREKLILSSLQLQKAQEQARRIDGLDAMKEALLATVVDKAGDPVQNADSAAVGGDK